MMMRLCDKGNDENKNQLFPLPNPQSHPMICEKRKELRQLHPMQNTISEGGLKKRNMCNHTTKRVMFGNRDPE